MLLAIPCWPTQNLVLVAFCRALFVGVFGGLVERFFVRGGDFLTGLFWSILFGFFYFF